MKKEEVKKGMVVIPLGRAKHYITSLENTPSAVEIIAEGTNWCYHNQRIVQDTFPNRLTGVVGKQMKIDDDGNFVPNPDALRRVYPYQNYVTVPVFLEQCQVLKVEHDKKQELIQKENETRAALYYWLKTLGINIKLEGTSITFENLVDIDFVVKALEIFCAAKP